MTDGEELLDYIELFHFVVRIIGEDLNFLDIFRNGLSKILRSRVERFISELPSSDRKLNETSFIHSEAYNFLQMQITYQMKGIIDSIRRAKLWIPQGTGGQRSDPGATISSVIKIEPEKIGIPELSILRSIPTEKLTFSPDLTLYYISLLHATLSPDKFIRSFSYSLIRSAPQLFDPRHFFNVLKEALKFWGVPQENTPRSDSKQDTTSNSNETSNSNSNSNSNESSDANSSNDSKTINHKTPEVSFEFAASLALLLNSLSEIIHSVLDDDIEELLFGLIESIPKSPYFSLLINFDPSFKWLIKTLPTKSFKAVIDSSLDLLAQGSFAHLCLICRAVSHGIIGSDILVPALKAALPTTDKWPKKMRIETRTLFSGLVTRLPATTINNILDILADQLSKITIVNATSKYDNRIIVQVIVFSDFVINYMLNTSAPFHASLFDSVQKLIIINNKNNTSSNYNSTKNVLNRNNSTIGAGVKMVPSSALNGKRNVLSNLQSCCENSNSNDSEDLMKMFCSLCANPVRFLQSVEKAQDRSIFKLPYTSSRTTLYSVLFDQNETSLLSGDEALKSGENFIILAKQLDEIDPNDFSISQIETSIRFSLWPTFFRNFIINKVLYPSSSSSFSNGNTNSQSIQPSQQSLNLQLDSWMVSEEIKYYMIQIILTISIRESNQDIIQNDFTEFLVPYINNIEPSNSSATTNTCTNSNTNNSSNLNSVNGINSNQSIDSNENEIVSNVNNYVCEYSDMINQICFLLRKKPSSFQILKDKIPKNAADVLLVGSKNLICLSLLFEFTIWSEPNNNLICCFKRSRILPAEWFAFVASSLFVTIFNEPFEALEPTLLKFCKDSILYFVWFAVAVVKKLSKSWLDLIADENFEELMKMMLFPKISEGFFDEEIQYAIELHKKYQSVFNRFCNVINCK